MESYLLIEKMFRLMNEGSNEAVEFLKDIAKGHPCPIVRHEAIFALGEMAVKEDVEFLKKIVEEDSDYIVKHEALVAIGTLGKNEDIPFLEKYVKNEIPEISNSALVGIQRIKDDEDYPRTVSLNPEKYVLELKNFSPGNQNRRIQILFQLMLIGDSKSVEAIAYSLENDPSSIVRHEAGFVMGEIGDDYAVKKTSYLVQKERAPIVLHETLFALGTSGKPEALKTIEEYLNHGDYLVSESAKIAKDRLLNLKNPYSGARHFKRV